ncbi:unnamed protein product, partial [Staurois parvus]
QILTTSIQGTYTPFLPRPIFSFQRCHILNDNCVVMQHCTHMKFLYFFRDRAFFWWYLITSGIFIFS